MSTGGYFGEKFFLWEEVRLGVIFGVFVSCSGLDPLGLFGWVIVMGLGGFAYLLYRLGDCFIYDSSS